MTLKILKIFDKPNILDGRWNLCPKLHIICWTLDTSYNARNYLLLPYCFTLERIACFRVQSMWI